MTCDEVKPLLNARVDDEIDPVQRAALDSHIGTCSSCATELEKLQSVRHAIRGEMPYYKAPLDLRNQVRQALRGAEYLDGLAPDGMESLGCCRGRGGALRLATAPFLVNARNQRQLAG